MTPKPLPFVVSKPKSKPKIVQRGKAERMTIVAGFTGAGGAILCADTQETVQGYTKREVEKISVWNSEPNREFNLAIAAAADSGPYADVLTNELGTAIVKMGKYDDIKKSIENTLPEFYGQHIWPRSSHSPQIDTIVLAQRLKGGHADIFRTSETAVNYLSQGSCCIGIG